MIKNVLVVMAHPDDEVLGCGGTLSKWAKQGAVIRAVFLADGESSRGLTNVDLNELIIKRKQSANSVKRILNIESVDFFGLPDNRLDSLTMLDIVKKIESLILKYRPDTIITHHGGDVNIDHRVTHQAVIVASRPKPGQIVKKLLFCEILSSTDWQIANSGSNFYPNWFEDITLEIDAKVDAILQYGDELLDWPHPRSIEGINTLAMWRGQSIGVKYAEAFVLGRFIQ